MFFPQGKTSVVIEIDRMNINSSALVFCLAMLGSVSLPGQNLLNDNKIKIGYGFLISDVITGTSIYVFVLYTVM